MINIIDPKIISQVSSFFFFVLLSLEQKKVVRKKPAIVLTKHKLLNLKDIKERIYRIICFLNPSFKKPRRKKEKIYPKESNNQNTNNFINILILVLDSFVQQLQVVFRQIQIYKSKFGSICVYLSIVDVEQFL
eukprot:TRINITY_DN47705_c0_g1_i2.p1 TRINITY_DN47705_c0_g1~~TRINITY_DN47705_c0_g1_i2.p1  ORF type:complete len:133 (+),score=6.69 TRINITY_DN47705_c0_g1_i2:488-886(+)